MKNYYLRLRVDPDADATTIQQAYAKLIEKYPPGDAENERRLQEIREAFETLSDPQKRAAYDQTPSGVTPRPRALSDGAGRRALLPLIAAAVLIAVAGVAAFALSASRSTAPSAVVSPTRAATTRQIKVGLVTDTSTVNDRSYNQMAWAGMQRAAREVGASATYVESKSTADYTKGIDQFASAGYDVIVTVRFLMADATAAKAKQYPSVKFAIVDHQYTGDSDPYVDLKNVTSLMFAEDELGFLAGVVAGGMSKTQTVCSVAGAETAPVMRYVTGFRNGARWPKQDVETLNTFVGTFLDAAKGKQAGLALIAQDCDVMFGVGGTTGNGALLAAKEKSAMAIGVDVDQYLTNPEVKDALVTSAVKNVDAAVYAFVKAAMEGSARGGAIVHRAQNDGVGLAPYHDWETRVPAAVKERVAAALQGLKSGAVTTGAR